MAVCVQSGKLLSRKCVNICSVFVRNFLYPPEPPPAEVVPSLQERLKELNWKDPDLHYKVDISLPPKTKSQRLAEHEFRVEYLRKRSQDTDAVAKLEKEARDRKLILSLPDVTKDWEETVAPEHIKTICEHYGIYSDLFGDAYFYPRVPIKIHYEQPGTDLLAPVHRGNVLKPSETSKAPLVSYEAEEGSFWCLVMSNPDGHFKENDKEYLHWMIGNIPGSDISKGELLCDYMQPFPPKGTGFHRFVFILYKQDNKVDFSKWKKPVPCHSLDQRTFETLEFYERLQDVITPAGIAFFQSDWDYSLNKFYHNVLNMFEPSYEYDFPPMPTTKQEWFPGGRPFNIYLEFYRHPQIIQDRIFRDQLKTTHPFKPREPRPKYPNADLIDRDTPSWLATEMRKERMRWAIYKDLPK